MTAHPAIAAPLAEALADKGYSTLTPVQDAVLDTALCDADLLVSAQTGSGKTVAFGLALAPQLLGEAETLGEPGAPLALIIAPTRELALQVERELAWLYGPAGGRVAACIGGMDVRDERRELSRGVHILVGTPGRLVDHILRGSLDLSALRAVVLDEADEMLNMGFREELESILEAAPDTRRTLMFSATVSKPIARLAENYQKDAVRLSTVDAREQHIDIEYRALTVMADDVEKAVINLLLYHDAPTAIVFVARREAVNRLTARLTNRGFPVVALSGEFSQKERGNAIAALRDGRARVCVATDVAARGIDLPGLDLVIHADLPRDREGLLHRSGRTGRAGRKGVCALIVPVRARRRTERLLEEAGIHADWASAPSAEEIEAALDARLFAHPALTDPIQPGERDLASALLETVPAEQLAAAVIRLSRAGQSAPEDLDAVTDNRPPQRERREGSGERPRSERAPRERGARGPSLDQGDWVRLGIGRKTNADPKWIVPMLCKSGGFSREEIGTIAIGPTATHVELTPAAAEQLMARAGEASIIDKSIHVARSGPPTEGEAERPARAPGAPRGDRPERSERRERPDRPQRTERPDRPDRPAGKSKPKPRAGPKKPRGPNGEKKRSPAKGRGPK